MAFDRGFSLLIGVDTYRNAPKLRVPAASRDAQALADILIDPQICGYLKEQTQVLTGQAASRQGILAAIDDLGGRVRSEDTVFIFHCGHGDYGTDGNFNLICHDSRLEGDKVLPGTGISQVELLEKLNAIQAQRVLLVFNTCHAGEISPTLGGEPAPGGKNLPTATAEALLATGSGRVIITACRDGQFSWIGKGRLTIFTQALVNALKGEGLSEGSKKSGFINVFDVYTFVYEDVSQRTHALFHREQEPELTILKGVGPFVVALYNGALEPDWSSNREETRPPFSPAVRQVTPEQSTTMHQKIVHQFGKIETGGGAFILGNITIGPGGDFIGRDKVTYNSKQNNAMASEDLLLLLRRVRVLINSTQLENKIVAAINSDISSIEAEVQDAHPSSNIIKAGFNHMKALLEGADSNEVNALLETIQKANTLANSLFIV